MIDLDVHAHLAPINAAALEEIDEVQWVPEDEALLVDGQRIALKALFGPQRLIALIDENSVRQSLVSIPPPLYRQHLSRDAALLWTRYLNTELETIVKLAKAGSRRCSTCRSNIRLFYSSCFSSIPRVVSEA